MGRGAHVATGAGRGRPRCGVRRGWEHARRVFGRRFRWGLRCGQERRGRFADWMGRQRRRLARRLRVSGPGPPGDGAWRGPTRPRPGPRARRRCGACRRPGQGRSPTPHPAGTFPSGTPYATARRVQACMSGPGGHLLAEGRTRPSPPAPARCGLHRRVRDTRGRRARRPRARPRGPRDGREGEDGPQTRPKERVPGWRGSRHPGHPQCALYVTSQIPIGVSLNPNAAARAPQPPPPG